jgi:hypothetical protein
MAAKEIRYGANARRSSERSGILDAVKVTLA